MKGVFKYWDKISTYKRVLLNTYINVTGKKYAFSGYILPAELHKFKTYMRKNTDAKERKVQTSSRGRAIAYFENWCQQRNIKLFANFDEFYDILKNDSRTERRAKGDL